MPLNVRSFLSGYYEVALRVVVLLAAAYLCKAVLVRLIAGRPVSLVYPPVILPVVLWSVLLGVPRSLPHDCAYRGRCLMTGLA